MTSRRPASPLKAPSPGRTRRSRSRPAGAGSLQAQWGELAVAVPQVVGHRLARMALAGPSPSKADRREFHRMGAEKLRAFQQSWLAMWAEAWRQQQRAWMLFFTQPAWWAAWPRGGLGLLSPMRSGPGRAAPQPLALPQAFDPRHAVERVLHEGLKPVRRKAVSNAERLGRLGIRG